MGNAPSVTEQQREHEIASGADAGETSGWAVIVHGGAGAVPVERRATHAAGCQVAADKAAACLRDGGTALDAVEIAVRELEDNPSYNAGRGSCLNEHGEIEHDAAIMEGTGLRAAAVGALRGFASPVEVVRRLLDADHRHVFLVGEGAQAFARNASCRAAMGDELITDAAREALKRVLAGRAPSEWAGGTVGAVARDAAGKLAAATSTGGVIGKSRGRIGDTPIIGAGTLADDECGALSATGFGEAILRIGLSQVAGEQMRRGETAEGACRAALERLAIRLHARAGIIGIDARGRVGWARSTETMSYAWVTSNGADAGI